LGVLIHLPERNRTHQNHAQQNSGYSLSPTPIKLNHLQCTLTSFQLSKYMRYSELKNILIQAQTASNHTASHASNCAGNKLTSTTHIPAPSRNKPTETEILNLAMCYAGSSVTSKIQPATIGFSSCKIDSTNLGTRMRPSFVILA
jgi:hypothetical protein